MAEGGHVKGDCLECPFHSWMFRGEDGFCESIPYTEKGINQVLHNIVSDDIYLPFYSHSFYTLYRLRCSNLVFFYTLEPHSCIEISVMHFNIQIFASNFERS